MHLVTSEIYHRMHVVKFAEKKFSRALSVAAAISNTAKIIRATDTDTDSNSNSANPFENRK